MGVATSSLANPTRTKALMVRLAPYLVEAVCELARALKDKTHAQTEISGLLFGKSQDGLATVEALKTFKDSSGPRSDLARRERMEKAFTAAMALATEDPEFAAYKLLGWFSLRGGGGLINSDVEFHNRHFKTQEEIALIVWREGDTQITTELYAPVEPGRLTTEDYRWSSVRLSTELRHVSQPVDLVMRVRMNDDLYMRTYGIADGQEKKEEWKRMAENAKRTLLSLLPGRRSDVVFPDDLPIPESTGTAKRSFDSRTLFRGTEAEPSSAVPAPLPPPPATTTSPAPAAPPPTVVPVAPLPPPPPATGYTKTQQTTAASAAITPPQPPPPPVQKKETELPLPAFDFKARPRREVPEVGGLPMVIPKSRPEPAKGMPWFSTALVFLAFSGLTFAFMALKTADNSDSKINQVMRVLFPGSDLELRAASHGDSLWISWNRRNPVVAVAAGALLNVSDGARHFERKLDASQVAAGEVKYTPVSGDVTFQLKVYGTDQSVAVGSLRVLDATSPVTGDNAKQPLDLSPTQSGNDANAANKEVSSASTKAAAHGNEVGGNNKVDLSKLTPPPIPASDLPPAVKKAAETKPAVKPAPAQPTRPQPETPVVQQPQQQPVQTAQQQAPAPPTPPPAVPKPAVPTPQQTSNTAINGWDPNLPETKPAPAQPQAAPPDAKSVDFMPPKVLLQVMPNTRAITPGSITEVTRVDVEVAIDRLGHVKSAHVTSANVKSQLATAAVTAAKAWTFQPATLRGQTVDSDHTIRFEFRPEGQ